LKRAIWFCLLVGVLLWSAQAFVLCAAEEGGKSAEGGASQLLWKMANFAILAGLLGYMIYKKAGAFFQSRTEAIRKDIEEAGRLRQEAEERAATIELRMRNLEAEIESLRAGARAEMTAESERLRQEAEAGFEKMRRQAEQEIASAAKAARHEVRAHAAELAVDLAAGKIRARMSPTTDEALTGAFLDGIEKKPGVRPHEELN
jgi:F-type H+-transporting ATPase subunit b